MSTEQDPNVWTQIAAEVPVSAIEWRQDGKPVARGDKFFARFVAFISANTVRERLDAVVPGNWDLTLELLPPAINHSTGEDANDVSFKARLQILGVIREDVGTGKDYKSAATDAFKRAGVRFGIAHELYDYEQNWVQVDGDSRFAKPLIDPGLVYARRSGSGSASTSGSSSAAPVEREPAEQGDPTPLRASSARSSAGSTSTSSPDTSAPNEGGPSCPKCGGRMWDNRLSKRNPKAPDFKCRDRSCDGVVWPPRAGSSRDAGNDGPAFPGDPGHDEIPGHNTLDSSPLGMSLDDIPF